jgi:hypothetical protein
MRLTEPACSAVDLGELDGELSEERGRQRDRELTHPGLKLRPNWLTM